MSCRNCIDGKCVMFGDSGTAAWRPPRTEKELEHADNCPDCTGRCTGCDEIRESAASVDGDEYCEECAVSLFLFASGRAA